MIYKGKELPIDLKAGDVLLYRNEFKLGIFSSWLSTAIRAATSFPYNHSAVITENNGRLFINEALGHGIVKRPASRYLERKGRTYMGVLRPKVDIDPTAFTIEADRYLGIKYDVNALIVHHLLYRLGAEWKGSTNDKATGKLVCSEYVQLVHHRPEFWLASTAEVARDPFYELIWEEKPFINI